VQRRFLLLIVFAVIGPIGCADNIDSFPTPNLDGVSQPTVATIAATPAATDAITELEWAQLIFDVKDRIEFRPSQLPERIRELDGKLVRVRGYFHPGSIVTKSDIKEFLLLGEIQSKPINAKECYADPYAIPLHYLMTVRMADGKTAAFTMKPIAVVGRFSIKVLEFDGKPICIFNIVADSVVGVRPRDGYSIAMCDGC